jgi:acyl-ACP thioesterase
MSENKRPCFCPDDKSLQVSRRAAKELLRWQQQNAKGEPSTPVVDLSKLYSIDPYEHMNAKMLAFLQGTHRRLGERAQCVNLDADLAAIICKMFVAQCEVDMLQF